MGYFRRHAVDLEKSVNFYTEILGLNVTTVRPGGMMVFMSARGNASHELALIDAKGAPEDAREKGIGLVHFAWEMASLEELRETYRKCVDQGMTIDGIADHGVSLGFYFSDPDGNEIELFHELPPSEWPQEGYLFAGEFPGTLDGQVGEKLTDARL